MKEKTESIHLSDITIDPAYQRDVDAKRVKTMAAEWNPLLCGLPVLAHRKNGERVAIDGQHRIAALTVRSPNATIQCRVIEGLSIAEEARLFIDLNWKRVGHRLVGKWKADLVAREPTATHIAKIVDDAKLNVGTTKSKNTICAIGALYYAERRYGNLGVTLQTLRAWAPDDLGVYDGDLIKAVSHFLAIYESHAVDAKYLSKKLSDHAPDAVCRRIKRATNPRDGMPAADAAVVVLRELYNYRAKKKLPSLQRLRENAQSTQ